jgi:hypothetical protein
MNFIIGLLKPISNKYLKDILIANSKRLIKTSLLLNQSLANITLIEFI